MCNRACVLCLKSNARNIIINNTYLQPFYEKLAELKIDNASCWMCFICHKRLQQCHQLWQLAEHPRPNLMGGQEENESLMNLSSSQMMTFCISSTGNVGDELKVNVKREALNDDTDDRTACSESVEQSSKLSSCNEYEDSVQDIKYVIGAKVDQRLEDVQKECEEIKEEYLQESMILDRSDEETAPGLSSASDYHEPCTGIVLNQDVTSSEEILWRPKVLKLEVEVEKFKDNIISKYVCGFKEAHSKMHADDKQFNCNICDRKFTQEGSLQSHIKYHIVKPFTSDVSPHIIRTHTDGKPFSCDICQRKFSQKHSLQEHLRIHTGEKPFNCDICHRQFRRKDFLKGHLKVHSGKKHTGGEKPFSCAICQRMFSNKSHLQGHLRTHTDEKPFSCDICQRKFKIMRYLQDHLTLHTEGEKPFSCDICQRKFRLKKYLPEHLRMHTNEKPVRCDICQRMFRKKSDLQRHVRTHTGEKPFSCDICQRKYSQKLTLKEHLRIHTGEKPFSCGICQRMFHKKSNLQRHVKTHTDEKPFSCYICQRKFSGKSNLWIHLKIHTDIKPFSCDICQHKFSVKSYLRKHLKNHK